jgi:hypothetical protein
VEYYQGDWALRLGRFMQPRESNGLPLDARPFRHYGDQIEVEHGHEIGGEPGKVRVLAFRNQAFMGGFEDAVRVWRDGGGIGVPDVAAVRRERSKSGWGVSLEQALTGDVGLFVRLNANDGKSETYAFTEVERSFSGGAVVKGLEWGRPSDVLGIAVVQNDISSAHRDYLASGGLGAFIGDGVPPAGIRYRHAPERIVEAYYSAFVARGLWASVDYQAVRNPAYNADRGPAHFFGARLHFDF